MSSEATSVNTIPTTTTTTTVFTLSSVEETSIVTTAASDHTTSTSTSTEPIAFAGSPGELDRQAKEECPTLSGVGDVPIAEDLIRDAVGEDNEECNGPDVSSGEDTSLDSSLDMSREFKHPASKEKSELDGNSDQNSHKLILGSELAAQIDIMAGREDKKKVLELMSLNFNSSADVEKAKELICETLAAKEKKATTRKSKKRRLEILMEMAESTDASSSKDSPKYSLLKTNPITQALKRVRKEPLPTTTPTSPTSIVTSTSALLSLPSTSPTLSGISPKASSPSLRSLKGLSTASGAIPSTSSISSIDTLAPGSTLTAVANVPALKRVRRGSRRSGSEKDSSEETASLSEASEAESKAEEESGISIRKKAKIKNRRSLPALVTDSLDIIGKNSAVESDADVDSNSFEHPSKIKIQTSTRSGRNRARDRGKEAVDLILQGKSRLISETPLSASRLKSRSRLSLPYITASKDAAASQTEEEIDPIITPLTKLISLKRVNLAVKKKTNILNRKVQIETENLSDANPSDDIIIAPKSMKGKLNKQIQNFEMVENEEAKLDEENENKLIETEEIVDSSIRTSVRTQAKKLQKNVPQSQRLVKSSLKLIRPLPKETKLPEMVENNVVQSDVELCDSSKGNVKGRTRKSRLSTVGDELKQDVEESMPRRSRSSTPVNTPSASKPISPLDLKSIKRPSISRGDSIDSQIQLPTQPDQIQDEEIEVDTASAKQNSEVTIESSEELPSLYDDKSQSETNKSEAKEILLGDSSKASDAVDDETSTKKVVGKKKKRYYRGLKYSFTSAAEKKRRQAREARKAANAGSVDDTACEELTVAPTEEKKHDSDTKLAVSHTSRVDTTLNTTTASVDTIDESNVSIKLSLDESITDDTNINVISCVENKDNLDSLHDDIKMDDLSKVIDPVPSIDCVTEARQPPSALDLPSPITPTTHDPVSQSNLTEEVVVDLPVDNDKEIEPPSKAEENNVKDKEGSSEASATNLPSDVNSNISVANERVVVCTDVLDKTVSAPLIGAQPSVSGAINNHESKPSNNSHSLFYKSPNINTKPAAQLKSKTTTSPRTAAASNLSAAAARFISKPSTSSLFQSSAGTPSSISSFLSKSPSKMVQPSVAFLKSLSLIRTEDAESVREEAIKKSESRPKIDINSLTAAFNKKKKLKLKRNNDLSKHEEKKSECDYASPYTFVASPPKPSTEPTVSPLRIRTNSSGADADEQRPAPFILRTTRRKGCSNGRRLADATPTRSVNVRFANLETTYNDEADEDLKNTPSVQENSATEVESIALLTSSIKKSLEYSNSKDTTSSSTDAKSVAAVENISHTDVAKSVSINELLPIRVDTTVLPESLDDKPKVVYNINSVRDALVPAAEDLSERVDVQQQTSNNDTSKIVETTNPDTTEDSNSLHNGHGEATNSSLGVVPIVNGSEVNGVPMLLATAGDKHEPQPLPAGSVIVEGGVRKSRRIGKLNAPPPIPQPLAIAAPTTTEEKENIEQLVSNFVFVTLYLEVHCQDSDVCSDATCVCAG